LFGARFRENAGRALLIPRAYPGKRTPLWQQRLKSQSLLEVAKRYGDFPVILETYRECLRDVFDVPGTRELLAKLHRRELSLVEVETPTASPFASSLLFDYVATYMYEGDTPNAERRAAALSLDRDLLRELLGQEELRELIDPGGLPEAFVAEVPGALTALVRRYAATHGPFTTAELRTRYGIDPTPALRELERAGDVVRGELRPGGTEREWCDAEVLRRLRRASLAALRREVEPVEQAALGRFLPSWHGIDRRASLREALIPLQSLALPVALWEAEVLPR